MRAETQHGLSEFSQAMLRRIGTDRPFDGP